MTSLITYPFESASLTVKKLLSNCVWYDLTFFARMLDDPDTSQSYVIYTCEYGWARGNDITTTNKGFRYSDFYTVYQNMLNELHADNPLVTLPPFPPKRYFTAAFKSTIDERTQMFDTILKAINQVPGINNTTAFKSFFNVVYDDKVMIDSYTLDY